MLTTSSAYLTTILSYFRTPALLLPGNKNEIKFFSFSYSVLVKESGLN